MNKIIEIGNKEMSTLNHIMLDIETLGTGSNAVVVSISAIIFDIKTGDIGECFEVGIDTNEQVIKGGTIDQETIDWWDKQSGEAKSELSRLLKEPVYDALTSFNDFIKRNFTAPSKIKLWGNGATFDNVIVRNLFKRQGIDFKIPYYADMDVRTLVYLAKVNTKSYDFVGVKHRGIDDCKHQIKYCVDGYRKVASYINQQEQLKNINEVDMFDIGQNRYYENSGETD